MAPDERASSPSQQAAALARAKELFFFYDASDFHMGRDGAKAEFDSYAVPAETQRAWLRELTVAKLAMLGEERNFRVVSFLTDRQDFTHLCALLDAAPKGTIQSQCAYLELLLEHIDQCADGRRSGPLVEPTAYDLRVLRHAVDQIGEQARRLGDETDDPNVTRRVTRLIDGVAIRMQVCRRPDGTLHGFWRWNEGTRIAVAVG